MPETGAELDALGVVPLSASEAEQLDELGYVVLGQVIDPPVARAMGARIDELTAASTGPDELRTQEPGDLVANLIARDPMFDICVFNSRVLGAMQHLLGEDFHLFAINARNPGKGEGHQPLHADWHEAVDVGSYRIANTMWMLDDFTADNGPTRLLAGSHRFGKRPTDVLDDPAAAHPDQSYLQGTAGTVAVFNAHVWHGGTENVSGRSRRSITCAYSLRSERQQYDIFAAMRDEDKGRFTPAQLRLIAAE